MKDTKFSTQLNNMITKQNALKWTAALRSGKYQQTKFKLQDQRGYCCLGVACDVFIPKNKIEKYSNGMMIGLFTNNQPHCPDWLRGLNVDFNIKSGRSLSNLNDGLDFTFDEIADLIELVYVHRALD